MSLEVLNKIIKNEYLVLYAIADMFAYHFLSNDLAKLDEQGNIIFMKNPRTFEKPERRIYEMMWDILTILNKSLSREAFLAIKRKYENLLQGFKNSKYFSEYAPVFVALSLLGAYVKEQKRIYKVHPKSVEKILYLTKKSAKVKLLENFVLNSLVLGEKFYKEMSK